MYTFSYSYISNNILHTILYSGDIIDIDFYKKLVKSENDNYNISFKYNDTTINLNYHNGDYQTILKLCKYIFLLNNFNINYTPFEIFLKINDNFSIKNGEKLPLLKKEQNGEIIETFDDIFCNLSIKISNSIESLTYEYNNHNYYQLTCERNNPIDPYDCFESKCIIFYKSLTNKKEIIKDLTNIIGIIEGYKNDSKHTSFYDECIRNGLAFDLIHYNTQNKRNILKRNRPEEDIGLKPKKIRIN